MKTIKLEDIQSDTLLIAPLDMVMDGMYEYIGYILHVLDVIGKGEEARALWDSFPDEQFEDEFPEQYEFSIWSAEWEKYMRENWPTSKYGKWQ